MSASNSRASSFDAMTASDIKRRGDSALRGLTFDRPEATPTGAAPKPLNHDERTRNPLRPHSLKDMIGQERMRALLRRFIDASRARNTPLDHMLLVGPSGYGKTTVANAVANELGVTVYAVEAPISHETLLALREVMRDRDILFIDEIHQQAIMERRGKSSSTQPEVLFSVMEDRTLVSGSGVLPFPAITIIGATTDEGMLPDPFVNRFPIRPNFERYATDDLAQMAFWNGRTLSLDLTLDACTIFAEASRGVPRQINNYVKNAASLVSGTDVGTDLAEEVVIDLNRTTLDGLTLDQQKTLTFLYDKCERQRGDGEIVYQASVSSIATAIGKSRDTKAVQLRVEPWLIEQGYLQVGHGGRRLTDAGIRRAVLLINEGMGT